MKKLLILIPLLTVCVLRAQVPVTGISTDKPNPLVPNYNATSGLITITISPADATNKNFTWESSDPTIAIFIPSATNPMAGNAKAVGAGSAVITFTSQDGGYTASVTVNVSNGPIPELTELKINRTSLSITRGGAFQFILTPIPTGAWKTAAWESSNPSVATVDGTGKMNALTVGTTVITATSNKVADISVSCAVTVTDPVGVSQVAVMPADTTVALGAIFSMRGQVIPENATITEITWSGNNNSVATVDALTGEITALCEGIVTVTAKSADGDKTGTGMVTVKRTAPLASIHIPESIPGNKLTLMLLNPRKEVSQTTWTLGESIVNTPQIDLPTNEKILRCEITYSDGSRETIVKYLIPR